VILTPTRLLLGLGTVVLIWNATRGYDLVPDYLQSRSELLCQICEGRAFRGTIINTGYRRLSCADHVEQEATLVDLFEWKGIEISGNDPFDALLSMPSPSGYMRKRSVEMTYILDEGAPTKRVVKVMCKAFIEGGKLVKSVEGNFTEYQLLKLERTGDAP
jgi:hypothetical protein